MDDRGRLAQPLKGIARWRILPAGAPAPGATSSDEQVSRSKSRTARSVDDWATRVAARLPRGGGHCATLLVLLASLAYGAFKGDHVPSIAGVFIDARDGLANAVGLRVASITLAGNHHVTREEVLAVAGVTGTTSLLFLDVEEARERLKSNPWIADATVLKLYPRELQISIKEREGFALWQKDGRVSVVAGDGTVLEPYVAPRLVRLPLVVGRGAESKAKEFLALLDAHPALRDLIWASVLVGERRWNLRLKNGIEVRLPESAIAPALERLAALEREKNLLTRDIVVIDLRLSDRVTVRLSDAAAQARMDALKDKPKKRGSNA